MVNSEISSIIETITSLFESNKMVLNQLVLFGSYAQNNQTEESDIDLIIVSSDFRKDTYSKRIDKVLGLNWTLVKKLKKPFDVILYSDAEWENSEFLLIREAKKYGKILYKNQMVN